MNANQPKPKKVLTKEQKAAQRREKSRDRAFIRAHRRIFERAGFTRLQPVDGVHFTYQGIKSELDDIFVFENVIVIAEYTRSAAGGLGSHAKGKVGIHNKITENRTDFLGFFKSQSPGVSDWFGSTPYTKKQIIIRQVYGSIDALEDHHQALFNGVTFMSRSERDYFAALTKSIKCSSRFELFEYLKIDPSAVGESGNVLSNTQGDYYQSIILPEEQSHFPPGFRVVSFYVDPDAILRRCYVLRRNGWRDGLGLYQRLIIPNKISSIRSHLKEKKRVFANNVVITLPQATKFSTNDGAALDYSVVSKPTPAILEIPKKANSIGIIDGQHRIFSYYQDNQPDVDIDKFRVQQNLLATGIIYPVGMDEREREKFEAGLFLEINSTQAGANSDIIQAIWVLLDPFRPVSVARVIVNRLADTTPLKGHLARTSLDAGKIRTASIVAYGLQPLTKRSGTDSLFHVWDNADAKKRFIKGIATENDLSAYINFAVGLLGNYLDAIRVVVGNTKWRIADKDGDGILSVTTVNGFIILLRKLIEDGKVDSDKTMPKLDKLGAVQFKTFKSSQYADLAAHMLKLIS